MWLLDICEYSTNAVVLYEASTVEISVFSAEFVAMRQGINALRGLMNKLRMIGIPISGPSYIHGDNMSLVHDPFKPESLLRKKSNSVCYYVVHESVSMSESLIVHIPHKKMLQIS